jgi:hypothetical protein
MSRSIRKMAILPYEALNNLSAIQLQKPENKDPNLLAMSRLEREMGEILNNTSLSSETKLALYQQLFHRYGNIDKQVDLSRTNLGRSKDVAWEDEATTGEEKKTLHDLLQYIPKAKKNKAKILLDHIEANSALSWNGRNELIVNGVAVKDTNLIDLITDLIKDKGVSEDGPPGIVELTRALAKSNVPRTAILNPKRRNLIYPMTTPKRQLRGVAVGGVEPSDDEEDVNFATSTSNKFTPIAPKEKTRRKKTQKGLQTGNGKWLSYY